MFSVIQPLASNKRIALPNKPLGEFGVVVALMIGVQLGLAGFAQSTDVSQGTVDLSTLELSELLALVEQAKLAKGTIDRTQGNSYSQAVQSAAKATAARFTFKPPIEKIEPSSSTEPMAILNTPKTIDPLLSARFPRFSHTAVNAATDIKSDLAVWDVNKQFALAKKPGAPIYIPTKPRKKNNKFVIMIDPGHGGSDPGSKAHNGLLEKTLTLDIAKRASALLADIDGVSVQLTRYDDSGMTRKSRVRKVRQSNADMLVSLHLNHLPQKQVNLVETFYAAPHNIQESIEKQREANASKGLLKARSPINADLSFTSGSRKLAKVIQKKVFKEVNTHNPITSNSGIKEDTLYILTRSFTPGVLIELSCLSNVREAELLTSPDYRNKLAAALADGIRDYLKTPEAKGLFAPGV